MNLSNTTHQLAQEIIYLIAALSAKYNLSPTELLLSLTGYLYTLGVKFTAEYEADTNQNGRLLFKTFFDQGSYIALDCLVVEKTHQTDKIN